MKSLFCLFAFAVAQFAAAAPTLTVTSVTQDAGSRLVTIAYTLDRDAIVTFESAVGTRVIGDVYRKVSAPGGEIRWYPQADGAVETDAFTLRAWDLDDPPTYFVLDLDHPAQRFYYPNAEALPFSLTSPVCRGQYLVMRRIYAKDVVWPMGSPTTEPQRGGNETQHYVKLTNDYYLAIFPTTIGQNRRLVGASNSYRGDNDLPVDAIGYTGLRGTDKVWPTDGRAVSANSNLAKIRALTGLEFDLPTEAEWEYACRAGTAGAYNVEGEPGEFAWYSANNAPHEESGNLRGTTRAPGQKKPNAWGLYDMHGNVSEWCLDWYADAYAVSTDIANPVVAPVGPAAASDSQNYRVKRGGSYYRNADMCRSARRLRLQQSYSQDNANNQPALYTNGFRLALPIIPSGK